LPVRVDLVQHLADKLGVVRAREAEHSDNPRLFALPRERNVLIPKPFVRTPL
jgi:hypothetical protein